VAKIETAIRDAIVRGARKQIRQVASPLRREVRRLRQALRVLRVELSGVRDVAAQWQRAAQSKPWQPDVTDQESRTARLSPRLVRKLRTRLALSQALLSRLVGVSAAAVVQWERGRSTPSGRNRKALVALRKLGRRDVKRLLASLPKPSRARKRPARTKRRAARRRRRK
jgi:DNA-binding transcriptional regulator YiaG